jgi:hypothetical protein
MKAGEVVTLENCRAYPEASPEDEVMLNGEYLLEEFLQREPAAYIPESGWVVIAPFVAPDSYIEWRGEDGELWRDEIRDGKLIQRTGHTVWD